MAAGLGLYLPRPALDRPQPEEKNQCSWIKKMGLLPPFLVLLSQTQQRWRRRRESPLVHCQRTDWEDNRWNCHLQSRTRQTGHSPESQCRESITQSRFGIDVEQDRFKIVHVTGQALLTSKGFMTMILHIVLPMVYTLKCLWLFQPDIFYDTTGTPR